MGLRAAPSVRAQGSAKAQPFLFQGAEAIFGGTEEPVESGAGFAGRAAGAEPRSGGR